MASVRDSQKDLISVTVSDAPGGEGGGGPAGRGGLALPGLPVRAGLRLLGPQDLPGQPRPPLAQLGRLRH